MKRLLKVYDENFLVLQLKFSLNCVSVIVNNAHVKMLARKTELRMSVEIKQTSSFA